MLYRFLPRYFNCMTFYLQHSTKHTYQYPHARSSHISLISLKQRCYFYDLTHSINLRIIKNQLYPTASYSPPPPSPYPRTPPDSPPSAQSLQTPFHSGRDSRSLPSWRPRLGFCPARRRLARLGSRLRCRLFPDCSMSQCDYGSSRGIYGWEK